MRCCLYSNEKSDNSLILARPRTFIEIEHEVISMVIFLLLLIQEGLLSVTGESMCMKYWLTACSGLPRKKTWLGELTVLNDHSC